MPATSTIENKLPVFTTPQQQITFYADDPSSYKQILTIYNPYEYPMRFRISCTDCSKYTVSVAQGSIRSNHSVNLVIHHKAVIPGNIGVSDTVRIQLYSDAQMRAGGRKELILTLLATAPRERVHFPPLDTDNFQQLEADEAAQGHLRQHPIIHDNNGNYLIFKIVCLILGVIVMFLPKDTDESEFLPSFMYKPTLQQKFFTCYFLGIITVMLIRT